MGKRYYWLKLMSDFFQSLRVKKLRKMKRGDTLLIIYLKMQLKTLSTLGAFECKSIEDLAIDLDERPSDVRTALDYLIDNDLCQRLDDTHFFLPWVQENTGSETASTQRWRDWKNRQDDGDVLESNKTPTTRQHFANVDIEKEKEIDKEIDIDKQSNTKQTYRLPEAKRSMKRGYANRVVTMDSIKDIIVNLDDEADT